MNETLEEAIGIIKANPDSQQSGLMLYAIRNEKLYEDTHKTFDSFLRESLGMSLAKAIELIAKTHVEPKVERKPAAHFENPYPTLTDREQCKIVRGMLKMLHFLQIVIPRNAGECMSPFNETKPRYNTDVMDFLESVTIQADLFNLNGDTDPKSLNFTRRLLSQLREKQWIVQERPYRIAREKAFYDSVYTAIEQDFTMEKRATTEELQKTQAAISLQASKDAVYARQ